MDLEIYDIDNKLLEQFSALGTTDKDELIGQLKAIVGSDVNSESCRFFLELAGWNLQRAIGAYFDFSFENSPSVGSPSLISITACNTNANPSLAIFPRRFDLRICANPSETCVLAGHLSVTIQNCGSLAWIQGTYLRSEENTNIARLATRNAAGSGALWMPCGNEKKMIPLLQPAQCIELAVDITPPPDATFCLYSTASLVGALSFCLPDGEVFGETLYCTAIPDLTRQTWLYQRGVRNTSSESYFLTPMDEI